MTQNDRTDVDNELRIGVALFDMGGYGWALSREQVAGVIDRLLVRRYAVTGGDVISIHNHGIEYREAEADSWACDRARGESFDGYAQRAADAAKAFVDAYPTDGSELFILIVSQKDAPYRAPKPPPPEPAVYKRSDFPNEREYT